MIYYEVFEKLYLPLNKPVHKNNPIKTISNNNNNNITDNNNNNNYCNWLISKHDRIRFK